MVDVRFELTTNDPWSVDDAICEGISPLGYWQKVHPSPTQTKCRMAKVYRKGTQGSVLAWRAASLLLGRLLLLY